MPQNKFALARYRLIDALMHRRRWVKTSEMVRYCREKTGFNVSQRTIQLDLEAMKHDSFLAYYAPIAYDATRRAYYYTDPDYELHPALLTPDELRLLEELLRRLADRLTPSEAALLERLIARCDGQAK